MIAPLLLAVILFAPVLWRVWHLLRPVKPATHSPRHRLTGQGKRRPF